MGACAILMHSFFAGVLLVFISAFGFGLMPIFALYAYRSGINVPTLLFLRFGIAAICLFAYISARRTRWVIPRGEMVSLFFLGGVLYTLQSTFYFSAVRYIPASLAALILYLYPVIVALLAVLLENETLSWKSMSPALLSLIGIVIVLGVPVERPDWFGVLLAFGAALVYSVYIIIGRRVVARIPALVTTAFISVFAAVSFLVYGGITQSLNFDFPVETWVLVLGIVLFSTILAMATFFAGMDIIGSTRASILSTIEPVITIGFSVLLLDEKISWGQGAGALLVLTGTIWVISQRGRSN
jgi:drug/metabolite transporter (DMT)-like permease